MKQPQPLTALAKLAGVQPVYRDVSGEQKAAGPETLLGVLRALDVPIQRVDEAADQLRQTELRRWLQAVEPVAVAWDGQDGQLAIRMPSTQAPQAIACTLTLEDGATRGWQVQWERLKLSDRRIVEGIEFQVRALPLPDGLPLGYHTLNLEIGSSSHAVTILSAPLRAQSFAGEKTWGSFIPLYALRSQRNWGAGNYSDLADLAEWTAMQGGSIVGTLPLLPGFCGQPFDPSPYSPVSRLLWNEFYIDVTVLPELRDCPAARKLIESAGVRKELRRLRATAQVDYQPLFALQRRVLELLAQRFFHHSSARQRELAKLLRARPAIADYARFRAAMEKQHGVWHAWPDRMKAGDLQAGDYDESVEQLYLYAQFAAHEQMDAATRRAKAVGAALYLDLPLGVHPDGYDAWRHQALFASRMSTGAPPDPGFPGGQDWGFAPLAPARIRADGYRYVAAYIRHHMSNAGILRIDHVMGLHRLYWLPVGLPASAGAYVNYPAEELYAVLTLESRRAGCAVIGEDLGTVPPAVGPAMTRHNLQRMYVLPYEIEARKGDTVRRPPRQALASMNNHDMPHFAGYWKGVDIQDRLENGLITRPYAAAERRRRKEIRNFIIQFLGMEQEKPCERAAFCTALHWLSASPARILLVNLEDLWGETVSQNLPGTSSGRRNWRGKSARTLEELSTDRGILVMLTIVKR